jgi:D-alanyl-lipoteichoic acid acyltransferase DltB (MBOAT superfamily)
VYIIAERIYPFTLPEAPDRLAATLEASLLNIYCYYFYLYCNFSGYCDVVIGIGSLLGVRPPENFNMPFLATNISDYWSRWHRSLTLWLTSYVFSPLYKWCLTHAWLGQRPLLAMNVSLLATMLISGLWHGTTLNFAIWGALHGVFLIVFRSWETLATTWFGKSWLRTWQKSRTAQFAGVLVTFHAVALALVFFRFEADQAFQMFESLALADSACGALLNPYYSP